MNPNCLLMAAMYAACFGTELTMDNNLAALYESKAFGLDQANAAAVAFSYGFMNIFSRATGGIVSDWVNTRFKMRGRLFVHWLCILLEGGLLVLFSKQTTLAGSITVLQFFAIFNEAACGTSYAITPYIDPDNAGPISGIVGAGGNVGAILWGLIFLFNTTPTSLTDSMTTLGYVVMGLSFLTFFISIPGHAMLIGGTEDDSMKRSNSKINTVTAHEI
jgi:NNP family nitrate/nitrite transporter-like MFS transporter